MPDLSWLTARPIAHRGLHGLSPGHVENCPLAFDAAIARRFPIECDIQLTQDGEAVVFHDATLDRLTDQQGPVIQRRASDLKTITFKATDDHMITLGKLFSRVAGRVGLVVEIKSHFDSDLRLTRRAIACAKDYAGPLAFMSFDHEIVACLRQEAPHLTRGYVAESHYGSAYWQAYLTQERIRRMESFADYPQMQPDFLSWRVQDLPNPASVLYRHGLQKPVICWTVRTDEDRALAAREADQITFEGFCRMRDHGI